VYSTAYRHRLVVQPPSSWFSKVGGIKTDYSPSTAQASGHRRFEKPLNIDNYVVPTTPQHSTNAPNTAPRSKTGPSKCETVVNYRDQIHQFFVSIVE
jgi:hypothetical protein